MSSEKKSGQGNQHHIARGKQSRRQLLKTMAAGSGAVIAGKSMPEQWTKPVINSVLLPGHAVTSCSITGTMTAYAPQDTQLGDPVAIPGSVTYFGVTEGPTWVVPQISVTPGITDTFTLETNYSDVVADSSGTNQNLAPDPANGVIAFAPIFASDNWGADERIQTTTLTPDNPGLCGGALVTTITFTVTDEPG